MVAILIYVLLGIFIYIAIIPIVEELATVIVQGLEVIKGKLVLKIAELQAKADTPPETSVHAIGFAIPSEEDYEEDIEEDDD